MKEIEHLPDEWYIKDSKAVTEWFQKNISDNINGNINTNKYFFYNNSQKKDWFFLYLDDLKQIHPNAIEITEDQLFNIPKTINKKDNKRLYEILNYIKQNA